jgi:hypothetical protein
MKHLLLALTLALTACTTAQKDPDVLKWKTTCAPFSAKQDYPEFCLHQTQGKLGKTLLYFHGLADSAHAMLVSPYPKDNLIKFAKDMGYSHILLISFGKNWLLRPAVTGRKSVDEFVSLIWDIEKRFAIPNKYHAIGISMGGANLAILCTQVPELFEKCALLNPMLVRADQYGQDLMTEIKSGNYAGLIVNDHYTKSEWQTSNPFTLLAKAERVTPLWVTACPDDGFKLYDNAHSWVGQAIVLKHDVTWRPAGSGCKHSSPMMDGLAEWMRR